MKHKEYTKLMKTPFDKLSKEDQQLRTTEFNKRLQLARTFMLQLREGKIDKNFTGIILKDISVPMYYSEIKIVIYIFCTCHFLH